MPGAPKPSRPLASPEEVAEHLGVPADTLKDWRYKHEGPEYSRVGKHVRYNWDDVDAWVAARRVDPRPAAQGAA